MNKSKPNAITHKGYSFRAVNDSRLAGGTGEILNYYDPSSPLDWRAEEAQKATIRFRGALLQLFGEPYHMSSLSDEAFVYIIEVTDDNDQHWILTAYEGPAGSAIGGKWFDKANLYPLAETLIELIDITTPADFKAVVYDDDTDNTVCYGFKDGDYFYREMPGKNLDE